MSHRRSCSARTPRLKWARLIVGGWLLVNAAFCQPAEGWNDVGHRLIALVTWELLDESVRRHAVDLLERHERFQVDFAERLPRGMNDGDRARWLFARAAFWPDLPRGFRDAEQARYHHPTWHYINLPVFLDDGDRRLLEGLLTGNTEFQLPARFDGNLQLNLPQALQLSRNVLRDDEAPERVRAVHLCWLLHLVGDLHQPLHSASLYSRRQFPRGDRGGNAIRFAEGDDLHRRWDGLLGRRQTTRQLLNRARLLLREPRLRALGEGSQGGRPEDWLRESHHLAEHWAYTAELRAAVSRATVNQGEVTVTLDEDYFRRAGSLAQQQAVRAGYRLARLLENDL